MLYKLITNCRVCNSQELQPVVDLGAQPPVNSIREQLDEALPVIPLVINRCGNCTTIQLTATVKPEYLFKDYVWVTGTSKTAKNYSLQFYKEVTKRCREKQLFVVEIASNDGTFLKPFRDNGHDVLGVDPAENIAMMAKDIDIPTISEFFGLETSNNIIKKYGTADCVFARNVMPHVENVDDVVAGMAQCLKDEGVGVIEFHYSRIILEELHYDSIYHEHLCYYSIESICYLLQKHGLFVFDVLESPISGGSLVLFFSKRKNQATDMLKQKIVLEQNSGVGTQEGWNSFARNCANHKEALKALVYKEFEGGARIIGYGASARSSTLLNFCDIDSRHLVCIADQSAIKHNKYTPGTDILIVSPETAFSKEPDVVLLLAWNFKEEILSIMKNQYRFKGKVILPLPGNPQLIEI